MNWEFMKKGSNRQELGADHVSIVSPVRDYFRINVNRGLILKGVAEVSIAVDRQSRVLGVFPPKGGALNLKVVPYAPTSQIAYISCTEAVCELGLRTGRYLVQRSDPNAFFTISASSHEGNGADGNSEGFSESTASPARFADKREAVCDEFICALGREVSRKERHNGYQLSIPGGPVFGYVRLNIKGPRAGKMITYIHSSDADTEQRFTPQPGNAEDLWFAFDPENRTDRAYALAALGRAYDGAAQGRQ